MKALLLQLQSDDDWDESDAREKVFKDVGERRFYYQKGELLLVGDSVRKDQG